MTWLVALLQYLTFNMAFFFICLKITEFILKWLQKIFKF